MRIKKNRVTEFIEQYSKEFFVEIYAQNSHTQLREKYKLQPCHISKLLEYYGVPKRTKAESYALRDQINIERYGCKCPLNSEEVIERTRQSNMEKYGVPNPSMLPEVREKMIETNIKNHGGVYSTAHPDVAKKRKKTCLDRYGVESPSSSNIVKKKIQETCINRYGVPCVFIDKEKIKSACLEKFGKDNYFKTSEFQIKARKTCNEKYGTDFYTQTEASKQNLRNKKQQTLEKIHATRKARGNWNSSKAEQYFITRSAEELPKLTLKYQYTDERYCDPNSGVLWNCDFYFIELDLFIELNFHISHGSHPFNSESTTDLLHLAELEKKKGVRINHKNESVNNSYYSYIDTWTRKDPLKQSVARTARLNYIALYAEPNEQFSTIDELIEQVKNNSIDYEYWRNKWR